ncbi:MAG: phosphatidylserine decarboxylase [Myxococcales bacterium]|nr:phosphatidylserine decarboxylase [Myxococcales bacterium]
MTSQGQPPIWLRAISDPRLSQVMHKIVTAQLPGPFLRTAIRTFSKVYGVELHEAQRAVADFETFQAFFTRQLKEGSRTICTDAGVVASPADGTLSSFGSLESGRLVQAKGVEYSLDSLLGDSQDADAYRNGSYAVVYLAPYNYHRVHSAWRGTLTAWRYLPGALFPVNAVGLKHVPGLFAKNERIIGHFDTEFGRAALIMVGATFVGHMTVAFDEIRSNTGLPPSGRVALDTPMDFERGDEFGVFEMGSTVVLVFERNDLEPALPLGSPIRMGQPALRASEASS